MELSRHSKRAITGGIISMLVMSLGTLMLGELSGYKAKELITVSLPGINTLCNTIALASATILALLLTLLGITSNAASKLKKDHYQNLLVIAKVDTMVFVAALISFLLFNLPITESENVPSNWFNLIYYITMGVSSILSAALIVVVLMLYNTVVNMIKILGLKITDHPLLVQEEENSEA